MPIVASRRKAAPPQPAEPTEFEIARTRWTAYCDKRRALETKIAAMELALSMQRNPDADDRVPLHLRELAKPYRNSANRRPEKLAEAILDARDELEQLLRAADAESIAWARARRRETDRIARDLQPRHREAVRALAAAVEALSLAIAAERAIREDLRSRAPEPQSALLPDCSTALEIGTLQDYGAPAWRWRRSVTNMGVV